MTIEELAIRRGGRLYSCISLLLYWLVSSDGKIEVDELKFLNAVTPADHECSSRDYLELLQKDSFGSVLAACKMLSSQLDFAEASHLVELLMGVMISDNRASFPEIFIIQFVADLFCIDKTSLNRIYLNATGREFPMPGDLSSPVWWEMKEPLTNIWG